MKINWGYSIALAFIGFAIFILNMVIQAYQQDINLVSEDYYAKEINYQEQLDKMNNASGIEDQIILSQTDNEILIQFPMDTIKGSVYFFRPSDEKEDFKKDLALNSQNQQHFTKEKFQKGLYKVQLDWQSSGKKYFVEKNLYVQ